MKGVAEFQPRPVQLNRIFQTSRRSTVAQRPGYLTFLARAWDDRGNVQPMAPAWNPLGYFWNGVHRLGVLVEA